MVVGMEADIYPRQCVTGSAKSAMMNVLAGINPQCTPPLPSSSAVPPPSPPPPPTFTLPISPLPSPSFPHPLTIARPHTLSRYISFLPSSFLPAICSLFVSASPLPVFLGFSFAIARLSVHFFWLLLISSVFISSPGQILSAFFTIYIYIFLRYSIHGVWE